MLPARVLRERILTLCLNASSHNSRTSFNKYLATTTTKTATTTTTSADTTTTVLKPAKSVDPSSSTKSSAGKGKGRSPERWRELRLERKNKPSPKDRSNYTFDTKASYSFRDALNHVRKSSWADFDESVEFIYRLNVDPRKQDQVVRIIADLPHGLGRKPRIIVFADGEDGDIALKKGAELVGSNELIERVKENKARNLKGVDVCLALPEMMRPIAENLGKKLGPRGLMPSLKLGTITDDVGEMVEKIMKGRVWHKVDRFGNLHTTIGKMSFDDGMLEENAWEITRAVMAAKPEVVRRKYVLAIHMCSSMGPGVTVKEDELVKTALAKQIEQEDNTTDFGIA